jgi:hypothetical protein
VILIVLLTFFRNSVATYLIIAPVKEMGLC